MSFGDDIRRLRTKRGWTQDELGRRAGIGMRTVSNYENRGHTPKVSTAELIMWALGYQLRWVPVEVPEPGLSNAQVIEMVRKYGLAVKERPRSLRGQLTIDDKEE